MNRLRSILQRSQAILLTILLVVGLLLFGTEDTQAALGRDRGFLNLDLLLLDTLNLPEQTPDGQVIQAWTGLTYDRQQNLFYSLATLPDPANLSAIYLAQLSLDPATGEKDSGGMGSSTQLRLKTWVPLTTEQNPLTVDQWHPHSLVLSPETSVFIAGSRLNPRSTQSASLAEPFICEFALTSGQQQTCLSLPERYRPLLESRQQAEVSDNDLHPPVLVPLGAVTRVTNGSGVTGMDPFPLFTAAEFALPQDINEAQPSETVPVRWLQALLNSGDRPFWIAEYAYPLNASPGNGLEGLLALGQSATFLSVESSRDPTHPTLQIYQVMVSNATDTSRVDRLENLSIIKPLKKKPLLDLTSQRPTPSWLVNDLSLGPQSADGSQRVFLMGDRQVLVLKLTMRTQKRFQTTSIPDLK